MLNFISRAEQTWKESVVLAWILVFIGLGLALWATILPQSPGVSIGLLALVAGVMSVRPEMRFPEKVSWVTILIALATLLQEGNSPPMDIQD
jgi:hypothetical protein